MRNWDKAEEGAACTVEIDRNDAKGVCFQLGIPFHEVVLLPFLTCNKCTTLCFFDFLFFPIFLSSWLPATIMLHVSSHSSSSQISFSCDVSICDQGITNHRSGELY